jgi:hypothetical protein
MQPTPFFAVITQYRFLTMKNFHWKVFIPTRFDNFFTSPKSPAGATDFFRLIACKSICFAKLEKKVTLIRKNDHFLSLESPDTGSCK